MSKRKKSHRTTKNTVQKSPVLRFRVIRVEMSNGSFNLVTNYKTQEEFNKILMEWYDSPLTKVWNKYTLIDYIKEKEPNRICLLEEDFNRVTKDKMIPATKEEYEAENN